MKNIRYKFGSLTFFIYLCNINRWKQKQWSSTLTHSSRVQNLKKKMIGMENKGYELQQEFYKQDSLLFDELIEANNKKGGNNGE